MRLFLVFLVLAAAIGGYWYWTTTPHYSVRELRDSIKTHDVPKFRKYVDIDSVSSRMVDDFLTEPVKQALGPNVLGQWIIAGLMGFIKPDLVKAVSDDLIRFVETGEFKSSSESGTALSLGTVDKRLGFRKHAFRRTEYCNVTGKMAIVGLRFHNETYDQDLVLELKMQDEGGYWRVIELTNFPEFIGKILEAEGQRQRRGN